MSDFAINHMTVPHLSYAALLDLSRRLGCNGIEVRNDLAGQLFDGLTPSAAGDAAREHGVRLLALAEISRFDHVSSEMLDAAEALMQTASACDAEAISLIPRNDGLGNRDGERQENLLGALNALKPLLERYDLVGLVEPLGFTQCSLRSKAEAIQAIEASECVGRVKLVHDTFHHYLAGGGQCYPEHTGIVHISGVTDNRLATEQMHDEHRELVDEHDRLGNLAQLTELANGGYSGPISIEAFSPTVHAMTEPEPALAQMLAYITTHSGGQHHLNHAVNY